MVGAADRLRVAGRGAIDAAAAIRTIGSEEDGPTVLARTPIEPAGLLIGHGAVRRAGLPRQSAAPTAGRAPQAPP